MKSFFLGSCIFTETKKMLKKAASLTFNILLQQLTRELGNEIEEGRKFSKIRQMSGSLQKPFSGGSRPLGTKRNQDKC